MKPFKSYFIRLFSLLLLGVVGFFGCEHEAIQPTDSQQSQLQPGKYRHTIELEDGANSTTLIVSSDNEAALAEFESHIAMKATAASEAADDLQATAAETFGGQHLSEENAIHISTMSSRLEPGMQGFKLEVGDSIATGKVAYYSGGPYYFYSYSAPHYFRVTPLNGRCVSAWLQQKGSTWTYCSWAGGSGGNYLCTRSWAASSNVNSLDYRLKAQGARFDVYYY